MDVKISPLLINLYYNLWSIQYDSPFGWNTVEFFQPDLSAPTVKLQAHQRSPKERSRRRQSLWVLAGQKMVVSNNEVPLNFCIGEKEQMFSPSFKQLYNIYICIVLGATKALMMLIFVEWVKVSWGTSWCVQSQILNAWTWLTQLSLRYW